MFKYLKKKEVTILGHDNIDVDSCISGILLSNLLSFKHIDNKFVILDNTISNDTYNCLLKLGYDLNNFKATLVSDYVFLVDHHITIHSDNVVGCVDHHPTIQEFSYDLYLNKKSSSCAKLIYDLMVEVEYPITKEDILLVIYSIFMDTCSMRSSKVVLTDKEWALSMIEKYNFNYSEIELDGLCLTDLTNDIDTLSTNGMKTYYYYNKIVKSSYIQVNQFDNIFRNIIKNLQTKVINSDIYLWVFLIVDFEENETYECKIYADKVIDKWHNGILSRGSDIMPKIEKELCEN